jgi:acetyl-CoA acetyltransferase
MSATDVAILGTGMTDMRRRDLDPDTMAYEALHEALGDAGVSAHDLGLVIVGNAMAGRLSNQGCVRGQTWLRKAGLSEAAIINVDNSCAGGSSSLHLATMAATVQDRPVLALGVEKMWTACRRNIARACTISGTMTTIPPAASSWASTTAGHTASCRKRVPPFARSPVRRSRLSTTRRATRWPSSSGG